MAEPSWAAEFYLFNIYIYFWNYHQSNLWFF